MHCYRSLSLYSNYARLVRPTDCNTGFSIYWLEGKIQKSHQGYQIIFINKEHKIKKGIRSNKIKYCNRCTSNKTSWCQLQDVGSKAAPVPLLTLPFNLFCHFWRIPKITSDKRGFKEAIHFWKLQCCSSKMTVFINICRFYTPSSFYRTPPNFIFTRVLLNF